jgi:hypothetical protein
MPVDDLRVDRRGSVDIHLRWVIWYLDVDVAVDRKGAEDPLVLSPHLIASSGKASSGS